MDIAGDEVALFAAFLMATMILCSGCATKVTNAATGGSKADGMVEMSYEYGMFATPVVNWKLARRTATRVCRGSGYARSQALGGQIARCTAYITYGNCLRHLVTARCQRL